MALFKYIFNEFICVIKCKYKFIDLCIKMLFMNEYVPVGVVVVLWGHRYRCLFTPTYLASSSITEFDTIIHSVIQ